MHGVTHVCLVLRKRTLAPNDRGIDNASDVVCGPPVLLYARAVCRRFTTENRTPGYWSKTAFDPQIFAVPEGKTYRQTHRQPSFLHGSWRVFHETTPYAPCLRFIASRSSSQTFTRRLKGKFRPKAVYDKGPF